MTPPVSGGEVESTSVSGREGKGRRKGPLTLDDCHCPVCLELFLEPVTLPCTHTFCKGCFLETVDKTTLCCPMCRKRVSTWARLNSKNNTLVNQQLWRQIQTCFPTQCERRLRGQESEDDSGVFSGCFPKVSQPGELRQEYEDQIVKLTEERRVLDEEEMRTSEEYIQRLLAEEEALMREERRRREEDERLAILLSNQLNSAEATPVKKKEAAPGQIEKFLCPLPTKTNSCCSPNSSFIANKENILSQREPPDRHLDSVEDQTSRSQVVGNGGPSSTCTKRKSCVLESTEEEEVEEVAFATKRGCHSPPSSSSSTLEDTVVSLQRRHEWETELSRRQQQQEEEDRRFALLLQKELNEEEKKRATNRQKGTADAYLLRQNRVGKGKTSTKTPRQESARTTKTSSASSSSPPSKPTKTPPPSSSSSSRGSKQITLTEMFTSLSS